MMNSHLIKDTAFAVRCTVAPLQTLKFCKPSIIFHKDVKISSHIKGAEPLVISGKVGGSAAAIKHCGTPCRFPFQQQNNS